MDASSIRAEIARLVASAHENMPARDRDEQSTMLTTMVMAQALPGQVDEVLAVHPIGNHSICEFIQRIGPRTRQAYAALEAL